MIVFAHIPKTAGSAITYSLQRMVGDENVFRAGKPDETQRLREMDKAEIRRHAVISDHLPKLTLRYICGEGIYCTILRDPCERTVSFYRHMRRDPSHAHHASTLNGLGPWLDTLAADDRLFLAHTQVMYVGGTADLDDAKSTPKA